MKETRLRTWISIAALSGITLLTGITTSGVEWFITVSLPDGGAGSGATGAFASPDSSRLVAGYMNATSRVPVIWNVPADAETPIRRKPYQRRQARAAGARRRGAGR
jgi:hypothetical protein